MAYAGGWGPQGGAPGGYPPQQQGWGPQGGGGYPPQQKENPYGFSLQDPYGLYRDPRDGYGRYNGRDVSGKRVCFTTTNKVTDKILILFGVIVAGLLVGPLLASTGWHTKTTHIWTVYIGLTEVVTKLDTLGGVAAGGIVAATEKAVYKIRDVVPPKEGTFFFKLMDPKEAHSIRFLRDQFCNVDLFTGGFVSSCQVWTNLLYGSWIALFGIIVEICFILLGCAVMCLKPTWLGRWIVAGLWVSGPLIGCVSLVAYFFLSLGIKEWLVDIYLATGDWTISLISILAVLLSIFPLAMTPILIIGGSFPWTPYDERLGDMAHPRPVDDEPEDYDDGSMDYGSFDTRRIRNLIRTSSNLLQGRQDDHGKGGTGY